VGSASEPQDRPALARNALWVGPTLFAAGLLLTVLDSRAFTASVILLIAAPGVMGLASLPGGDQARARRVSLATAVAFGLIAGVIGLFANACVASPVIVAPFVGALAFGTIAVATALSGMQAGRGRVFVALLAGSVAAAVGYVLVLMVALQTIFVLC
jgi:hypothetical protein